MIPRIGPTGVTALLISILFSACVTTGPGGEKSFILISDADEANLGKQVDSEVRKENKVLPDTAWQAYVNEVGGRIVKVCDRPNLDYQFHVIASDQVNAFALPGGHVYFYAGLLRLMDNESEMAAVMAHEISHVVARHSVKSLQATYGGVIGLQLLLGNKSEGAAGQLAGAVLGTAMSGYSRSHELEADKFGVYYMQQAGYNPNAALTMFDKLGKLTGDKKRGFFENLSASHPDTPVRIEKVQAQVAAMPRSVDTLPLYEDRYQKMKKRLPLVVSGVEPPPAPDSTKQGK
ncbi:MAG: M48 family metalloprotease [candidate division Zixibacteria bacterium]|nr:M48 family metalloprotease [candidate division Zixibacteria bacterium]